MKKLIAIGATLAVAFGASADGLKDTVTFETANYDVTTVGDGKWHSADAEGTFTVTPYEANAAYSGYTANASYAEGGGDPGSKYLSIEASSPLYRTAQDTSLGFANTNGFVGTSIGDGLFVDTLVKFTATESLDVPDLDGGRLAVWLGTDENTPSVTNLYVTAGALENGNIVATNFAATNSVDPNAWHRLTIRAITGVGTYAGGNLIGFTVFVDGIQIATADSAYTTAVPSATVNSPFVAEKQLFLGCTTGSTLEAVGFKGTGSVDDVTFADFANAPTFAKGAQSFTFNWTVGDVTALTIGAYTLSAAELSEGSYVLDDFSVNPVTISVTYATGKAGVTSEQVTLAGGQSKTITASDAVFTIGNVGYTDFASAYAAATSGATISVYTNTSLDLVSIEKDITFDLNGKTVSVVDLAFAVGQDSAATLTVISSVAGGAITASASEDGIFFCGASGSVVIGANNNTDAGVTITGALGGVTAINKGKFDKVYNDESELSSFGTVNSDGDYWTIGMGGSQQATGWDIVPVQDATAGATWGDDIDSAFAMADAAKLKTWGQTYNIDFDDLGDDTLLDAFLLNCAPAQVETEKAAFKLSITFENGAPVVSTPAGKNYNVEPVILGKASLSGEWTAAAYDGTHKFFQAVLVLPAAVVLQ